MKRYRIVLLSFTSALSVAFLMSGWWISAPSLTVKFYGKEAAGWKLRLPLHQASLTTDAHGHVSSPSDRGKRPMVFIPLPEGGASQVNFPAYGNLTIDYQGPRTVTQTQVTYFGLFSTSEERIAYSFTDEEMEALESGQSTLEGIRQRIDKEVAQQMPGDG